MKCRKAEMLKLESWGVGEAEEGRDQKTKRPGPGQNMVKPCRLEGRKLQNGSRKSTHGLSAESPCVSG